MPLSKLIVGGFKSIREPTEIPIAPLTLLFGPNSAGKTTVLQAMQELKRRLDEPSADRRFSLSAALVRFAEPASYLHQPAGTDTLDGKGSVPLVLGFEIDQFEANETSFDRDLDKNLEIAMDVYHSINETKVCLRFHEIWGGAEFLTSLAVDDETLLVLASSKILPQLDGQLSKEVDLLPPSARRGRKPNRSATNDLGGVRINVNHALWKRSNSVTQVRELVAIAERAAPPLGELLTFRDGWLTLLTITQPLSCFPWSDANPSLINLGDLIEDSATENGFSSESSDDSHRAVALGDGLACIINDFLEQVRIFSSKQMAVSVISGDRRLLSSTDTTFDANASNETPLGEYAAWLAGVRTPADGSDGQRQKETDGKDDFVNDALRLDMATRRGYRVEPEVWQIIERPILQRTEDEYEETESLRVSLYLKDSDGRELDFDEVGSGISYTVPILASLWSAPRSWIEQPELHLHPGAQCGLGDMFIRAYNRGRFAVVETHSEHLILRILKRIRQTTGQAGGDPELRCAPEAVAVLYFEPLDGGGTRVHHLRVSRGGDFLDRWPSGFFEERAGELFDE